MNASSPLMVSLAVRFLSGSGVNFSSGAGGVCWTGCGLIAGSDGSSIFAGCSMMGFEVGAAVGSE